MHSTGSAVDIQCGLWRAWHPVLTELPAALSHGGAANVTRAVAVALTVAAVAVLLGRAILGRVTRLGSYGSVVGRAAAVVVWGAGLAGASAALGIPLSVTVPILLTVVSLLALMLLLGAAGLLLPGHRHVSRDGEKFTPRTSNMSA